MIGIINDAVRSFIVDTYGSDAWDDVVTATGVQKGFVSACPYPDEVTYRVLETISEQRSLDFQQVLEESGYYFNTVYIRNMGYERLLRCMGGNLVEFLQNLNIYHLHLSLSFKEMQPPAFNVDDVTPESLIFHYASKRPGLTRFAIGLLRGAAKLLYDTEVDITVLQLRGEEGGGVDGGVDSGGGAGDGGGAEHDTFLIRFPPQAAIVEHYSTAATCRLSLDPPTLYQLFPFHMVLDKDCRLVQVGRALSRMYPRMKPGRLLTDFFTLRHPYIPITFERILDQSDNMFVLRSCINGMELKGQMKYLQMPTGGVDIAKLHSASSSLDSTVTAATVATGISSNAGAVAAAVAALGAVAEEAGVPSSTDSLSSLEFETPVVSSVSMERPRELEALGLTATMPRAISAGLSPLSRTARPAIPIPGSDLGPQEPHPGHDVSSCPVTARSPGARATASLGGAHSSGPVPLCPLGIRTNTNGHGHGHGHGHGARGQGHDVLIQSYQGRSRSAGNLFLNIAAAAAPGDRGGSGGTSSGHNGNNVQVAGSPLAAAAVAGGGCARSHQSSASGSAFFSRNYQRLHPGGDVEPVLLFLGSPRIGTVAELRTYGLFVSDLPLFDHSREMVLMAEQRFAEAALKDTFERLSLQLEEERQRSEQLLYQMIPRHIADSLRRGQRVTAETYSEGTILFSDVVNFTTIAAGSTAMEVCNMLDELYNEFDALIDKYPQVYKVETIGDAYMLVANVTEPCPDHVDVVLDFALDMHTVCNRVTTNSGAPIQIRVGIHTGSVVGGVVGRKMPRFHLFGDAVNTASRMESHGLSGAVHISAASRALITNPAKYLITERGEIAVKGKGLMETFLVSRASAPSAAHLRCILASGNPSEAASTAALHQAVICPSQPSRLPSQTPYSTHNSTASSILLSATATRTFDSTAAAAMEGPPRGFDDDEVADGEDAEGLPGKTLEGLVRATLELEVPSRVTRRAPVVPSGSPLTQAGLLSSSRLHTFGQQRQQMEAQGQTQLQTQWRAQPSQLPPPQQQQYVDMLLPERVVLQQGILNSYSSVDARSRDVRRLGGGGTGAAAGSPFIISDAAAAAVTATATVGGGGDLPSPLDDLIRHRSLFSMGPVPESRPRLLVASRRVRKPSFYLRTQFVPQELMQSMSQIEAVGAEMGPNSACRTTDGNLPDIGSLAPPERLLQPLSPQPPKQPQLPQLQEQLQRLQLEMHRLQCEILRQQRQEQQGWQGRPGPQQGGNQGPTTEAAVLFGHHDSEPPSKAAGIQDLAPQLRQMSCRCDGPLLEAQGQGPEESLRGLSHAAPNAVALPHGSSQGALPACLDPGTTLLAPSVLRSEALFVPYEDEYTYVRHRLTRRDEEDFDDL